MNNAKITVTGGCHCGAVKVEVQLSKQMIAHQCNCSICTKSGYIHLIVAAQDFRLLSGKEKLSDYRFNTGTARHLFCSQCGIKSFYVPRSHPDGFSVNANCLDLPGEVVVTVEAFDCQNWELKVEALVQLGGA